MPAFIVIPVRFLFGLVLLETRPFRAQPECLGPLNLIVLGHVRVRDVDTEAVFSTAGATATNHMPCSASLCDNTSDMHRFVDVAVCAACDCLYLRARLRIASTVLRVACALS